MHIQKAIGKFLEHLRANERSIHTQTSYQRDLNTFSRWLTVNHLSTDMRKVTPETILQFFQSEEATLKQDGTPRRSSSVNRLKLVMKSFCAYCEQAWIIKKSPARVVRCKKERRPLTDVLTSKEKKLLLQTARSSNKRRALRDATILDLFLGTGIRIDSLVHLDIGDVDLHKRTLTLRTMKGGGESVKTLSIALVRYLRRYLAYRATLDADSPALFLSTRGERLCRRQIQRLVKDWTVASGIEKNISSKSLRHSYATELYARTKDILRVRESLDHVSITTSERYTHLTAC